MLQKPVRQSCQSATYPQTRQTIELVDKRRALIHHKVRQVLGTDRKIIASLVNPPTYPPPASSPYGPQPPSIFSLFSHRIRINRIGISSWPRATIQLDSESPNLSCTPPADSIQRFFSRGCIRIYLIDALMRWNYIPSIGQARGVLRSGREEQQKKSHRLCWIGGQIERNLSTKWLFLFSRRMCRKFQCR